MEELAHLRLPCWTREKVEEPAGRAKLRPPLAEIGLVGAVTSLPFPAGTAAAVGMAAVGCCARPPSTWNAYTRIFWPSSLATSRRSAASRYSWTSS